MTDHRPTTEDREELARAIHAEHCCPCDPQGCSEPDPEDYQAADAALAWFAARQTAPTVSAEQAQRPPVLHTTPDTVGPRFRCFCGAEHITGACLNGEVTP